MGDEFDDLIGGPNASSGASIVRTGTVLASPAPTGSRVSVQVDRDGPLLPPMPYLASYVPKPGDLVWVLFAVTPGGSLSGLVLGGKAGQSGNLVMNGNFYQAPQLVLPSANNPPYLWERYVASGTGANACQAAHGVFQRLFGALDIAGNNSGDTRMVHAGFPVVAGETLTFTTFGSASVNASTTVTIYWRVAWMADDAKAYPDFISETALANTAALTNTTSPFYLTNTATVPAGATHARVLVGGNHVSTPGGAYTAYFAEAVATR